MAVRFSEDQVVKATGAHRVQSGSAASYTSVATDTRTLLPGALFVALAGERYDAHEFLKDAVARGARGAVVKEGRKLPPLPRDFGLFAVPDTLLALGALARFHRARFKIPVGAVTGSNGKTTTKEMAGAILATRGPALKTEGNLNNEVGVPLTLFRLEPSHVAAAIEMGMNRPGEIGRLTAIAQPDAGLITVVQAAHLEGLGSLEGVAAAKGELFHGLSQHGTAVVNLDDPLIVAQAAQAKRRTLSFGKAAGADVRLSSVAARGRDGLSLEIDHQGRRHAVKLAFVGEHNAHNAAAAFALGRALGYSAEECVMGLQAARPHPRRLNVVPAPGGVTVLDDCYNANPASMGAALDALAGLAKGGRAVAVLGDMLELGEDAAREHAALGLRAAGSTQLLALFGPRSVEGYARARVKLGGAVAHFTEVEPLLEWLRPQLREGDVVLVKGSRGMRLERVVDALAGQPAAGGGH
ncbi:MAG TPA: UDP-N-acetylmuramoyl-tripeptide--D-alanyl-D-alanine ligase [Myxococcales bacterium]|jgi:UDP-N-acetylmuramoyl-tripeptide--D-alanyl-D-alanine ligase|nr:UDP-N-acetylmuramoyl-tripeptide--D-alanyl-D-alanine ligase [Myxococcales bacterium]